MIPSSEVQRYLGLSQLAQQQRLIFQARVIESESPGFIKREAPKHITNWLRSNDLLPSTPQTVSLNREQGNQLLKYLKSEKALGAIALRGGGLDALGQTIPGVPYRPKEEALQEALRNYGIVIT